MVKKQVLRAHKDSRESLLEKIKSKSNEQKLAFITTRIFQNVTSILQELNVF